MRRRAWRWRSMLVELELDMLPRPYVLWYDEEPWLRILSLVFGKPGVDHVALVEITLRGWWWK